MTIAVTPAVRAFLRGLVGMPAETKEGVIAFYANNQNLSAEDLLAVAREVEDSEAEKVKEEQAKEERKLQAKEDERIRAQILAANILDDVLEHLDYVTSRKKVIFLRPDGGFDTTLRASKRGNSGGAGRPKKDAPTGYVSTDTGAQILGGFATFVKEQMEEDNLSDDTLAAIFTEGGNMRSKAKVIAALVEAGVIEADDSDSADD